MAHTRAPVIGRRLDKIEIRRANKALRYGFLGNLQKLFRAFAVPHGIRKHIVSFGVGKVVPTQIADSQFAEDIVDNRRCHFDRRVAFHDSGRIEACKGECIDEFFERHAVLQADGNGDGKIVHKAAERRTLFVHIDKNFADLSVGIFTGAQIYFVSTHERFLRIAFAAVRQTFALACDNPFNYALSDNFGAAR